MLVLISVSGCGRERFPAPQVPAKDPIVDQYSFAGTQAIELGMLSRVREDGTGFEITASPVCTQAVFREGFDEESLSDQRVLHFTSEEGYQTALGVNYKVISASLNFSSDHLYTITGTVRNTRRAKQKPNSFDSFRYCCSVKDANCAALGTGVVVETGDIDIEAEEYDRVGGDFSAEDKASVIATGKGAFKRTSTAKLRKTLKYFRAAALPAVSPPNILRDITFSPLRIVQHPVDGKERTIGRFFHVSVVDDRRMGYEIILQPAKPTEVLLEEVGSTLEGTGTYGSATTVIDCRKRRPDQTCSSTFGVRVNPSNPGSHSVWLTVNDRFYGQVIQNSPFAFEVIKEVADGANSLKVDPIPPVDLSTQESQRFVFFVTAPAMPSSAVVAVRAFHSPSFLTVTGGDCTLKSAQISQYECAITITRPTEGVKFNAGSEIVVVAVARSNVPTLSSPQGIPVKLPPPPAVDGDRLR